MDFRKHILSRGLPKTGQAIMYDPGDDGQYEAGWWIKQLNATNRTRYVATTIGSDVVVFDRATGLMWAGDGHEAGCNSGATITYTMGLVYANSLTFAGFSDWRLPNLFEQGSLVNYGLSPPRIVQPPFAYTQSLNYWSNTTYPADDTYAYIIDFGGGDIVVAAKTAGHYIRCVRLGV